MGQKGSKGKREEKREGQLVPNTVFEEAYPYERPKEKSDYFKFDEQSLKWQLYEKMFTLHDKNRRVHFNEADSKVALGTEPLDFSSSWTIEFVLIPIHLTFKRAMMVGISSEYMYKPGSPPLLGSTNSSWGWSYLGTKFSQNKGLPYGSEWTKQGENSMGRDFYVIQMEYCVGSSSVRFYENGEDRGVAFTLTEIDCSKTLFPAVNFASSGHEALMKTTQKSIGHNIKPAKKG